MHGYGWVDYLVEEHMTALRAEAERDTLVAAARRARDRRLLTRVIWWRPTRHPVPTPPRPARPLPA